MTKIVWSRRCSKCNGQLYLEENEDEVNLVCIQCSHSEPVIDEKPPARASSDAMRFYAKKELVEV